MQVSLNTYSSSNNQTNFTALKEVNCSKLLSPLIGDDAYAIEEHFVSNLKAKKSFNELCDKYDVFVNIKPQIFGQAGILLEKALCVEIFASKIKEGGFWGLFKKQPPKEKVSGYMASGIEAKTWSLANFITENYIKAEDGMEPDIKKFLAKQ